MTYAMQLPNVKDSDLADQEVRLRPFLDDVECHSNANPAIFPEPCAKGAALPATMCHPDVVSTSGHVSLRSPD